MKVSRTGKLASVAVMGALALAACGSSSKSSSGSSNISCASGDIKGAGSTFQNNMQDAWIKKYLAACSGANIDYASIGSGAGISQFGAGTVDYAGTDSTMKPSEQVKADSACGSPALHIPIVGGGIAIAYNLPSVKDLQLSAPTIAGIFQGKIKTWDDAAVKADNPGVTLPSTAVTAIHRADSSGTTNVLSKYLNKVATGTWTLGEGKELNWPAAIQGAKGSDGVTAAAAAVEGGVTYAEVSYVSSAKLAAAKVKNGAGTYEAPTAAAVSAALSSATVPASGNDLKVSYDFANTKAGAYPISAITYSLICTTYKDASKGKLVESYLKYDLSSAGQNEAEPNDYAPLPFQMVQRANAVVGGLS